MWEKLSIKQKFLLLIGVVLFSIFASFAVNYPKLNQISDEWDGYLSNIVLRSEYISDMRAHFGYGGAIHNFKNYVLRANDKYIGRFKNDYQAVKQIISDYKKLKDITQTEKEALNIIQETFDKYNNSIKVAKKMYDEGSNPVSIDKVIKINDSPALTSFAKLINEYNKLTKIEEKKLNSSISEAIIFLFVSLGSAFFISMAIILILSSYITKGIKTVKDAAVNVANGDLSTHITFNTKDEFGKLADSFNVMTKKLKESNDAVLNERAAVERKVELAVKESEERRKYLEDSTAEILKEMEKFSYGDLTAQVLITKSDDDIARLFEGFNQVVENIKQMILQVKEATEATAAASIQIASSAEEMAIGTNEQSSQTMEVVTAMQEMSQSVEETVKNATAAAEASKTTSEKASEGMIKLQAEKEGMQQIVKVSENTSKTISSLANKTDQIGAITQVIDEIADQTNLLALNAAIEAARAGEQGRGFAVVADEVRKLAERTTKATKEIAETIGEIQVEAKEANNSMEEAEKAILDGLKMNEEVGDVLNDILQSISDVSEQINRAALASREQSTKTEQVTSFIELINSVANETSMGVHQIAQASENLNNLTSNLTNLIAQFKIDESGTTNLYIDTEENIREYT